MKLSGAELDAVINDQSGGGGDVAVVGLKELRLYQENGEDQNRSELDAWATILARTNLANPDSVGRVLSATGFFKGELNGTVSEIRISQTPPRTDFRLNTWHFAGEIAHEAARRTGAQDGPQGSAGATLPTHVAEGTPGAIQPVSPVGTLLRPETPRPAIPPPTSKYQVYTPIDDSLTPVWTSLRFM